MIITREWAMPDKHTFLIKPIKELLKRFEPFDNWFDPFCGLNSPAGITNDLNSKIPAKYHLPAHEFCWFLDDGKYDGCLFDPPYSLTQMKECYGSIGLTLNQQDSTMFPVNVKNQAAKKIKSGGYVICFGWDTNGFGMSRGFELIEILLVCHGGRHNDTIVTVEKKVR